MFLNLWLLIYDNVSWQFSLGLIFLSGKVEQSIWGNTPAPSKEIISLISVQLCLHMLLKVAGFKLILPRNLTGQKNVMLMIRVFHSPLMSAVEVSGLDLLWSVLARVYSHSCLSGSCWNTSLQIPKLLEESPGAAQDLEDSSSSFIQMLAAGHMFVWAWLQKGRQDPGSSSAVCCSKLCWGDNVAWDALLCRALHHSMHFSGSCVCGGAAQLLGCAPERTECSEEASTSLWYLQSLQDSLSALGVKENHAWASSTSSRNSLVHSTCPQVPQLLSSLWSVSMLESAPIFTNR